MSGPVTVPTVTLTLPVRCTVAELRALLRTVPARAELVDVEPGDQDGMVVGVQRMADVALTFELPWDPEQ